MDRRVLAAVRVAALLLAPVAIVRALYAPLSLGLVLVVPPLMAVGWRRMDLFLSAAGVSFVVLLAALSFTWGQAPDVVGLSACLFALGVGTWAGWMLLSAEEKRGHERRKVMDDLERDRARLREEIGVQEKTFTVTENKGKRFGRMRDAVTALASSLEADRLADLTVQQISQLLSGLSVNITLFVFDATGGELLRRTHSMQEGASYPADAKAQDDPINSWVLSKGASLVIKDLEKDFRFRGLDMAHFFGRSFHLAPLLSVQGQVKGLVRIESSKREAMDQEDQQLVESLMGLANLAFENARLYREARELAVTDGLTRLLLRRPLLEGLDAELKLSEAQGVPLSLIMLDIDHFKVVNDTYGHPAGDAVLKEVAAMVKRSVRDVDVCGRYGGEEFLVLLPRTSLEGALLVAERIRETVRARPFDLRGASHPVTVSMGVATSPGHGTGARELIAAADEALYRSKQSGRDRVTASGASS